VIETIIGIVIIIEVVDKGDRGQDREIGCNRDGITTTISSIGIIRMIKTVVESTITTTVIKTAEKIAVEIEIEIEEAVEASLTHNQAIGRGESNLHHPHRRGHRLHPHHHQGRRRLRRGCRCRIRP
jgi:hypothetical protein